MHRATFLRAGDRKIVQHVAADLARLVRGQVDEPGDLGRQPRQAEPALPPLRQVANMTALVIAVLPCVPAALMILRTSASMGRPRDVMFGTFS